MDNKTQQKSPNVWMIVCNSENWDRASEKGVFGLEKPSKRIKRIRQGDLYIIYLTKIGFIGWGKITGPYYESNRWIWEDKKYKYRFSISSPETPGRVLPGAAIKDDLGFITEKRKWSVHFRQGVIDIPFEDFEKIKKALRESKTTLQEVSSRFEEVETTKQGVGNKLHNRIHDLFEDMGFSILENNYTKPGPDIVVEDPQVIGNSKILIQCKKTNLGETPTYGSLRSLVDEYAYKIKKREAVMAILVLSGYKLPKDLDPLEILEEDRVALWTDDLIEYYEELADKLSGFARYQLLADLSLHLKFGGNIDFDVIKVSQNNQSFYAFAVSPEWLLKTTSVVRRINFSGTIKGYQRLLKKNRVVKEIPGYLKTSDWMLPNAIVCATQLGTPVNFSNGKIIFQSCYGLFWVVDGQHRLYAFANSEARLKHDKILCVIIDSSLMGEDYEARQAKIFVDLNMHAKKVDRALLLELYNVLGLRDVALEIIFKLAETNIFKNSIISYSEKGGSINLTTFATNQAIKKLTKKNGPLISGREWDDERIRDYCFSKLYEYFKNVAKVFKEEWDDPSEYILKTDRGIRGLLKLYIKILEKYPDSNNIEEKIEKVLMALKNSNFKFNLAGLKRKYLGEGGADELVADWSVYITKDIEGFEPSVTERVKETFRSKLGDLEVLRKFKSWFGLLEGEIRAQLMHIDETTFEILRYLDKDKIARIKIFFGDASNEEKVKEVLKKMKEDGYDIILTKAKKPEPYEGALYHTRWIATDKYQIILDCDLKKKEIKNATFDIKLIEWNNPVLLKEFEQDWIYAEKYLEYAEKGFRFVYDWS